MASAEKNSNKSMFHIISSLVKYLWVGELEMRIRFFAALFFVVATITLNLITPLILKKIINLLSSCEVMQVGLIKVLLLVYGFTWLMSKITLPLREIVISRILERGIRRLSIRIFDHMHTLSLRFHLDRKTGAIASILSRVQRAFPDIFMELFIYLVPTIIEIVVAMGILWYMYSLLYAGLLFFILTIYVLFSILAIDWLAQAQKINNITQEKVSARVVDSLLNFETVKYFNNQAFEHEQCDRAMKELEDTGTRKQVRAELVHVGQGIIIGLGLGLMTWISGGQVITGSMQVGDFILINGYLLQFFYPLSYFGIILRHIRRGFTDMENALNLLEIKPEITDAPNAINLRADQVEIEFKNVSFGYSPQRPILKDVSFTIPAGKTVAIVGTTGSGKSTIARLLFRLYDVTSGTIKINGHDIRSVTQHSLQALLGIVPQDTVLFNNTLFFNVAYGNPTAPACEVNRAIELARLDHLIQRLPQGLTTVVGERGLKLSGGEKQRVSIARALVKKPKMYIFDEATSALDTQTERDIQKNIEEISRGSTAVIIAHRLSTVVNADRIVVLDNGHVAQVGSHAELIATPGIYKQLWDQQLLEQD